MSLNRCRLCKVVVSLLFLMCMGFHAAGQEPFFRIFPAGTEINGGMVQAICQDKQGFLWLGTAKGLFRYDGTSFMQVNADDSLLHISYTAIYVDETGTIWAGTSTGRIVRIVGGKPARFTPEEGSFNARITGIVQDHSGNTWFATYGEGLYCWTGHRMYNIDANDGLGDNFTYSLVCDSSGNVWTGTDGGISRCRLTDGRKQVMTITTADGLPDNIVLSLSLDGDSLLWAGMHDGGICRIRLSDRNIETPSVLRNVATGPVNDLKVIDRHLWIASETRGIFVADLHPSGECSNILKIAGISFSRVNKVLQDSQLNIWFLSGTDLIQTPGDKLEYFSGEKNTGFSNIRSIAAAGDGSLWFSNDTGLYRYHTVPGLKQGGNRFVADLILKEEHVVSLFEDRDGFLWIGTFGNGVFRRNPNTGAIIHYTERNGLANNNVLSIDGVDDEVWFATLGGASRCLLPEPGEKKSLPVIFEEFGVASGLGNNFIYYVFVDSKKRVWFATDGKGITMRENGRFRNFSHEKDVSDKIVYSITEEKNGHIWFSTSDAGLYQYDGKSFRNFTHKDGLNDLTITGLIAAATPVIFIVHPAGIDILDPLTEKVSSLGKEDGLEVINSNLNAVAADLRNDIIWVGTDKGILRLRADAFRTPSRPVIQLNSVKVFLTATDTLESHVFTYNRNHLTFDFVGLWYKSPDRVQYQVMLEGYDLDWISTRNTTVIYSSLEPGYYTFRVRASLTSDFADAHVAAYHFVIRQPFWTTAWFIGLILIMAGASVYLVIRTREKRLRREDDIQKEKILYQFETLKNQVNPHFLFNSFSTLSAIIDEDSEMAQDYVQKLSAFFRNILEFRDKPLITLREELSLADTYYYLQKKRYGSSLEMVSVIPEGFLNTFIPPMTLQMIIENAVKHNVISSERPLQVSILISNEKIVITNPIQTKKNMVVSTGMGLHNIRSRYLLLTGKNIEINMLDGVYTVSLPVIKSLTK
jgi:ligand-binding sensor domain-containing protein